MQSDKKIIIFDLDGTLYKFKGNSIYSSGIYEMIIKNTEKYIEKEFNKKNDEAKQILTMIKGKYGDNLSIGLEKELSADRMHYFSEAWSFKPDRYVNFNKDTKNIISYLYKKYELILLSDAPRIWIDKVLNYMDIYQYFKNNIYSGESDIRKEFNSSFSHLIKSKNVNPSNMFSIGDQERTDIIPANALGINTILISSKGTSRIADYTIKELSDLIKIL